MANQNIDIIRVEATASAIASTLINGQAGFDTTNGRWAYKDSVGAMHYFDPTGTIDLTDITIQDNTSNAFRVREGSNNYLLVDTVNASEVWKAGNTTTNPNYTFLGSGTFTLEGPAVCEDNITINADDKKIKLGAGADGELYSSSDNLHIHNVTQDKDIILGIDDGGVSKTITWDADVDKIKHSSGLFDFDDDNLLTTGNLGCKSLEASGSISASGLVAAGAGGASAGAATQVDVADKSIVTLTPAVSQRYYDFINVVDGQKLHVYITNSEDCRINDTIYMDPATGSKQAILKWSDTLSKYIGVLGDIP